MQEASGKRVMIVDSNRIVADTLVAIFTMHRYQARGFYSVTEALVEAPDFRPDLAIVDLFLGHMNGFEAALRISSQLPHCAILLMASVGTSPLIEQAYIQGWETLPKPIPPQLLLAKARILTEDGYAT
jgi:DNA-binding response OmpR family regulator